MSKFAFKLEGVAGTAELIFGFSNGGADRTAVFSTGPTIATTGLLNLMTIRPLEVPGGFPGWHGRRVFFDLMGSSATTGYVNVDLKLYGRHGTRPLYEAPTRAAHVRGMCLNNVTINSTVIWGGHVNQSNGRMAIAVMLGLLDPVESPSRPAPPETTDRFCGFSRGARLRGILAPESCP